MVVAGKRSSELGSQVSLFRRSYRRTSVARDSCKHEMAYVEALQRRELAELVRQRRQRVVVELREQNGEASNRMEKGSRKAT